MEPLAVSTLSQLRTTEFDILAKVQLYLQLQKSAFPPRQTGDWFREGLNSIRPWWYIRFWPSMLFNQEETSIKKQHISIMTFLNLETGEYWNNKIIYKGEFKELSLDKILRQKFPKLKNREKWKLAIEDYAKFLEPGINAIDVGRGASYGMVFFLDDRPVSFELISDIQSRARTKAFYKHRMTLYEHISQPQVSDIAGLDAWILQDPFYNDPPTLSQEMADLANFYYQIAQIHNQGGEPASFLPLLQELLKIAPNFLCPRINYSTYLEEIGNFRQAEEEIMIALGFAPEVSEVWRSAGHLYKNKGDLDNALECFQTAHDCDPSDLDNCYYIAFIYLNQFNWRQSIQWGLKAVEIYNNGYPDLSMKYKFALYRILSIAYFNLPDYKKALKAIKICVEISPNDQELLRMKKSIEVN